MRSVVACSRIFAVSRQPLADFDVGCRRMEADAERVFGGHIFRRWRATKNDGARSTIRWLAFRALGGESSQPLHQALDGPASIALHDKF